MRKCRLWMGGIAWMCLFMGCSSGNRQEEAAEPMQDIISALNDIPKLYLVEAKVDKVLLMNDQEWYTIGNRKCMIPVTAQVKAGIDLSKLKDIRIEGEDVYLTLPAPFIEIESSEIKHDEVQTSVGLLRSNFTQDEFSQFRQSRPPFHRAGFARHGTGGAVSGPGAYHAVSDDSQAG